MATDRAHDRTSGAADRASGRGLSRILEGATYLPRGMVAFARMPDSWVLGVLPALLAAVLAGAVLAVLLIWVDDLARTLTPFAGGWSTRLQDLFRGLVAVLLVVGYLALVVFTFAALAITLGQPFYERISDRVEHRLGDPPAGVDAPWWRTFPGSVADSARLLTLTGSFGIPLFFLGFVPVLGQTVVPVLGATVSGFFLAGELLSIPLQRRGLRLRARLKLLRSHLPLSVGFGVAAFLLFLIPVMNLLAMPGAVVGATLLARRMLPAAPAPGAPGPPAPGSSPPPPQAPPAA